MHSSASHYAWQLDSCPIPVHNILPFHACCEASKTDDDVYIQIIKALEKGNLAWAEAVLRRRLHERQALAQDFNFLGWIASALGLYDFAQNYFQQAITLDPSWQLLKDNLYAVQQCAQAASQEVLPHSSRYLLIRAWPFGFWSSVTHTLGALLLAELTGRTPIVYWGNSLFSPRQGEYVFADYFLPVSSVKVSDIITPLMSIWPPKWQADTLCGNNINLYQGSYSRVASFYLLNRPETLLVADFYTGILELQPWITRTHLLYGLSVDALYYYLISKYLHPLPSITAQVAHFCETHFGSQEFIAVHLRGSDKVREYGKKLDELNQQYASCIATHLEALPNARLFVMTDDERLLEYCRQRYGERVVYTACQRTHDIVGLHYRKDSDKMQLGIEVMYDVYIACQARVFIGNILSNVSLMVRHLRRIQGKTSDVLGADTIGFYNYNAFIYQ